MCSCSAKPAIPLPACRATRVRGEPRSCSWGYRITGSVVSAEGRFLPERCMHSRHRQRTTANTPKNDIEVASSSRSGPNVVSAERWVDSQTNPQRTGCEDGTVRGRESRRLSRASCEPPPEVYGGGCVQLATAQPQDAQTTDKQHSYCCGIGNEQIEERSEERLSPPAVAGGSASFRLLCVVLTESIHGLQPFPPKQGNLLSSGPVRR